MTLTIVATPGSASANSFCSEAEQIAYMATRTNSSAWTTFSGSACTETEKAAMIQATRELSRRSWQGTRTDNTQVLAWPRIFVLNPDAPWSGVVYYGSSVVPDRVKEATAELAFQFLNMGTTDLSSRDSTLDVKRKKVDVLETEYADPWRRPEGLARFPLVLRPIQPLLADSTGASMRIVRG